MGRHDPVLRITLGIVALTSSILLLLDLVGVVPASVDAALESRLIYCEKLGVQVLVQAQRTDLAALRRLLSLAVREEEEVLSAGLRTGAGNLLVAVGEHRQLWEPEHEERSSSTHVRIPIARDGRPWATLEVRFKPLVAEGVLGALWARPLVRLIVAVGILGVIVYGIYLRRTLRYLDPSSVIPTRVQAALDVMAEGVALLDEKQRIVLANQAFANQLERPEKALLGADIASLPWRTTEGTEPAFYPWSDAMSGASGTASSGLGIDTRMSGRRSFVVKASPVRDGWGKPKGAIVTFDDVTELEKKTAELEEALARLEKSEYEIRIQNEELQFLATCDPLTGVANRRALMDRIETEFDLAREKRGELCCIMSDIDHFKRVNDDHGHAMGDEVIRRVAEALASEMPAKELVGRYGGEEFCVILPGLPIDRALEYAERVRRKIEAPGFTRIPVSASFGVSSIRDGATKPADLIEQADQALYASKEGGRNRVTRWDRL